MRLRATSTKSRMHLTGRRPYDPASLGLGLTVLSVLRAFHEGTEFHRHPPSPSTSSLDLLREWRPGSAVCIVAPATIHNSDRSQKQANLTRTSPPFPIPPDDPIKRRPTKAVAGWFTTSSAHTAVLLCAEPTPAWP